jgi:hypothetical protein
MTNKTFTESERHPAHTPAIRHDAAILQSRWELK